MRLIKPLVVYKENSQNFDKMEKMYIRYFFRQITKLVKVPMAFVFGIHTL